MKTNNSNPTQGREVYFEERLAIIKPTSAPQYEAKIRVLRNATNKDICDALVTESEQFSDREIEQGVILTVFVGDDLDIREYEVITDNQFDGGYSEQKLLGLIRKEVNAGGRRWSVEYSESDPIIALFRERQKKGRSIFSAQQIREFAETSADCGHGLASVDELMSDTSWLQLTGDAGLFARTLENIHQQYDDYTDAMLADIQGAMEEYCTPKSEFNKIMSALGKRSAQRRNPTSEQMRELAKKRWKKNR